MAVRRLQHIRYKHLVPPNLYELGGTKNFVGSLRSRIQHLYPHYEIRGAAPAQDRTTEHCALPSMPRLMRWTHTQRDSVTDGRRAT